MRQKYLIIGLIVVSLLIIVPSKVSDGLKGAVLFITHPIVAFVFNRSMSVRHWVLVFRDLKNLPLENEELTYRISDLLSQNTLLKEVEHENALLRDELAISHQIPERHIVAAHVVSKNVFSFLDSLVIDKGTSDNVSVGQAVTLRGVLVGKVTSASLHESNVQLITSADAITQAQLQNSRMNGLVRGGIAGLILEFIPQDTTVVPGENVITSGLGGDMRSGILIGTVISVISKKSDIYQTITIKPAAPLNAIDTVFVEIKK